MLLATVASARNIDEFKTPDDLAEIATDIVLGVVESRSVTESAEDSWLERTFVFGVRVEEVSKGALQRGQVVDVVASNRRWLGVESAPDLDTGHAPLPLVGELARFHLVAADEDGVFEIVTPNGVELGDRADHSDPTRAGDPAPASTTIPDDTTTDAAKTAKDPFGWDVILVLLAVPVLIGSFRQQGGARWGLMGAATVMLLTALVVAIL